MARRSWIASSASVTASSAFVLDGVENIPAEDKIRGQARFVSDTVLRVDEHAEIQASRVVIATGSRPSVPPPLRDLGDRLVVNDDVSPGTICRAAWPCSAPA